MRITHHKAKLVFGLATVIFAVIMLTSATSFAQAPLGYWFDIRSIYTGPLGVMNPAEVAFATSTNNLVIFDTPRAGQTNTKLVLVPYRQATAVGLRTIAVADPLNMALSERQNEFWLLEPGGAVLSAWPAQSNGSPGVQVSKRFDIRAFGIQSPRGMSADPKSGTLYILDGAGRRIVQMAPDAQGNLNPAAAGSVTQIQLRGLAAGQLRGLAFNPNNSHLYVMDANGPKLYEFAETGTLVSTRNLADLKIASPQGMAFGPSVDQTDDPTTLNLYLADAGRGNIGGRIVELSLDQPPVMAPLAIATLPELIQTINTWQWSPPSPDPAGLAYRPATGRLLVSDSEVDEIPDLFTGKNVFETDLDGTLVSPYSTTFFTHEPAGVAVNPDTGHIYYVQDVGNRDVFEVSFGRDGVYGTPDDKVTTLFSTLDFGSSDPEGLAYGEGKLFVSDGANAEVYVIEPGPNGRFDGVPPNGDDVLTQFDTDVLGSRDPEGVEYDLVTGDLWIVSRRSPLIEVTQSGSLLRSFNLSFLDALFPSGIAVAPGSNDPTEKHIYISDRMVDNNVDPNENDGRIYELVIDRVPFPWPTVTPTSTPTRTPTNTPTRTRTPTNTPIPPTPTRTPALPPRGSDSKLFLPLITSGGY